MVSAKLIFLSFFCFVVICSATPTGKNPAVWAQLKTPEAFSAWLLRQPFCHTTDKSTKHAYESVYWKFIAGLNQRGRMAAGNTPVRIMEIGLGCFMKNGPGGSASLWRALIPSAKIHFFEYNKECGSAWAAKHTDLDVHLSFGDQSIPQDLLTAVRNSFLVDGEVEEGFDLIVDDGSHVNEHQHVSLMTLWKYIRPGGMYVVEDIHASCKTWNVPGTSLKAGGTSGCLETQAGKPTFYAHILKFLPGMISNRDYQPSELPGLESVEFHHESVVLVKRSAK